MKRFVSLILSVCFLFSINTVSYAANISSRKASNPVIQSMNDKYHVDFSGMSIDELNKFIDKMRVLILMRRSLSFSREARSLSSFSLISSSNHFESRPKPDKHFCQ